MKKFDETEARQGVTGHQVRLVLGISLGLAVVTLVGAAIFAV